MLRGKKGCGCLGGAFAGGCGCFTVAVIVFFSLLAGFGIWVSQRTYTNKDTGKINTLSKEICTYELPSDFMPVFGLDFGIVRAAVFATREKERPALLVLMDTTIAGLEPAVLNQSFELIATEMGIKNARIKRVIMSDRQIVHFYGTNTIERFVNTVYFEQDGLEMTWHQGIFKQGDRSIYACFIEVEQNEERAGTFFDTLKPAGAQTGKVP